jgi:tetratricopeptide (TPR) repeat protein
VEIDLYEVKILSLEGKNKESLKLLDNIEDNITDDDDKMEFLFLQGNILMQLGRFEKAQSAFKAFVEICEQDADETNYFQLAIAYSALDDNKKYLFYCFKSFAIDGNYYLDPIEVADIIINSLEDAEIAKYADKFKILTNEFPFEKSFWIAMAVCYEGLSLFEKSIETLDFAIAIDEEYEFSRFKKSLVLMKLAKIDEAIEILLSITDSLNQKLIYFALAQCYQFVFNDIEALKYLFKIVKLNKHEILAWSSIFDIYMHIKNEREAYNSIQKAIKYNPTEYSLLMRQLIFYSLYPTSSDIDASEFLQINFIEKAEKDYDFDFLILKLMRDIYRINKKMDKVLEKNIKKMHFRDLQLIAEALKISAKNNPKAREEAQKLCAQSIELNPFINEVLYEENLLFLLQNDDNDEQQD